MVQKKRKEKYRWRRGDLGTFGKMALGSVHSSTGLVYLGTVAANSSQLAVLPQDGAVRHVASLIRVDAAEPHVRHVQQFRLNQGRRAACSADRLHSRSPGSLIVVAWKRSEQLLWPADDGSEKAACGIPEIAEQRFGGKTCRCSYPSSDYSTDSVYRVPCSNASNT
jgi:hypothetical protein